MSRMDIVSGEELISGYDIVGADWRYPWANRAPQAAPQYGHPGLVPQGAQMGRPGLGFAQYANPYAYGLQQAAAFKAAQGGVILRDQQPTRGRKLVLPMASSGTVAAGTSATITSRPQTIAFKPARVVVPATIAPDFTIEDIKVGNTSQLAQSGSLPAEAFTESSFEVEMDMDTVQTSQDFVLQVTNQSGAARTFRAAVYGRAAC